MDLIYRYDPYQPIVPRRIATSDDARSHLIDGNDQFIDIVTRVRSEFQGTSDGSGLVIPIDPLALGFPLVEGSALPQEPFAIVLGCSDARAPIEMIFQQSCNDLFVVRVAGNVLGTECLGSIDYAVRNMGKSLKLIVVLGHTGCGAVTAAVDMYLDPSDYPDLGMTHSLRSLVDRVGIAVRGAAKALDRASGSTVSKAPGYRGALIDVAVHLNAALTAYDVRREVDALGDDHGIGVVFGVFDLASQRVRAIPAMPGDAPASNLAAAPDDAADFDRLGADLVRSVAARGILYRG